MQLGERLTNWRKPENLKVLLGLAFVVLVLVLVFAFASEVVEGETRSIDNAILLALRSPADSSKLIGPRWVTECMLQLTALGSGTVLTLVTVVAVASLTIARRYWAGLYTLAGIIAGQAANWFLKHFYAQQRPTIVPHLTEATSESFPSGHSMMAAVVYLTVGSLIATSLTDRRLKYFTLLVSVTITLLVGMSRVFLGVHYPSDVLGGWAFGLVCAISTTLAVELSKSDGHRMNR